MRKNYSHKNSTNNISTLLFRQKVTNLFIKLFSTLGLLYAICVSANAQYLHTSGTKILDGNSNEIILRGIGLGGWMLQEGYMLRTSGPQHEIEAKIEALIGPERTKDFYEAWLANHCRKIDIDSMAAWGYNSVRLPMHYKLFTPPIEDEPVPGEITWIEKGFEMVDKLLEWVENNDMYLILDLHAAPGGQGENADISDYDPSKPSLWESEANRKKMIALWRKLAERYADEPHIGAYDIVNEPNWGFQNHSGDPNGCSENQNTALWDLQKKITAAIREVDQNHIIVIEGNCWGNNYNGLPAIWDDNMVISYHKYWNANNQASIQGMLNMRQQRNVPIWLGETGENSNTWFTDAITLFEENGFGWAWWPLKKLGLNNPLQIPINPGYQQILNYWGGSAAKPSSDDAYAALMQLTENLKLENNIYHRDVVDAMTRQPHSDEALPFNDHVIAAGAANRVYATDYDLGRLGVAYHDNDATNETGNAGGLTWNKGYSYRNDGIDIEQCSDTETNGYNVGWTEDGEWMQYTLNVDSSGVYQVDVRYAAQNNGSSIRIMIEDADQSGSIALPATGGYQTWKTLTVNDIIMYKGSQKLKVLMEKGGFNFNFMEFVLKKKTSELNFKPVSGETSVTGEEIYLTVNKKIDPSTLGLSGFSLKVNDGESEIGAIAIHPGNDKKLKLAVQADLNDLSEIKLTYSGDQLKATDGTTLQGFTDFKIENNLPYHFALPAKIEAEDFYVNNGLELETTTDAGGGLNIGYTNEDDYLEYLIYVEEGGEYKIEARVACNSQAGILEFQQLTKEGELLTSKQLNVPVTGGWQTWQTIQTKIDLEEGRGILRVRIIQPEFNINWYNITKAGIVNGINENTGNALKVYPNPAGTDVTIEIPRALYSVNNALCIWGVDGRMIYQNFQMAYSEFKKLDIGKLPCGLYVLELSMDSKSWRHKLVVNQ